MTQSNQNVVSSKNTPVSSRNDKVGAFAAVLLSGMVIAAFVGYYLVLGEESRKKNSLQLIIAVSEILINNFLMYVFIKILNFRRFLDKEIEVH